MTVSVDDELPRPPSGAGFADAVTVSFGDPDADVFGIARVGIATGERGERSASGLGIVFADGKPVAVRAQADLPVTNARWEAITPAGIRSEVVEPLASWRVSFTAQDDAHGFELELRARSAPAELAPGDPAAALGGMVGYEQLCGVTGSVTIAGERRRLECLGQRGHSWGAPDWERIGLARTLSAWLDERLAVAVTAVRPARAAGHDAEAVAAYVLEAPPDGAQALPQRMADPRLSTVYDGEGRQRRAGLELYPDEEADHARRLAGDATCGTSLDLGRLRLDCAFFKWRMEGRSGVGRYDILRRA
jgi:hypothetical protein